MFFIRLYIIVEKWEKLTSGRIIRSRSRNRPPRVRLFHHLIRKASPGQPETAAYDEVAVESSD